MQDSYRPEKLVKIYFLAKGDKKFFFAKCLQKLLCFPSLLNFCLFVCSRCCSILYKITFEISVKLEYMRVKIKKNLPKCWFTYISGLGTKVKLPHLA